MECYKENKAVSHLDTCRVPLCTLAPAQTYHTTVRDQTTQVQSTVAVLGSLEGLFDGLVAGELVLLDGLINADDILPDHTTGADVQVADFRVTHESFWETDGQGGSFELGVSRGALGKVIHDGGIGIGDGVAVLGGLGGGHTPAINDDCLGEGSSESARTARDR